jgi:hypothetical protein
MYLQHLVVLLLLLVPGGWAGEVLDRMIATVNGRAILQSDWNDELRYECFMSGRSLGELTAEDRRAVFERLIDQELLREQMSYTDFKPVGSEEISQQVNQLKKQYAGEHNGESWEAGLAAYDISQPDVAAHVAIELNALRLVNARLRPTIQIDQPAVEDYYKKELLAKLPAGQQISLQEATPKIRELLIQQKMNELLSSWLESLRSQANIRILASESAGPQVQ